MNDLKKCSCCGKVKQRTAEFFTRDSSRKDGLHSQCRVCRHARQAMHRNTETGRTKSREYQRLPHVRAKRKAYQMTPKQRARRLAYYASPQVQERLREYLAQPEVRARKAESCRRWRERKKQSAA
jgi:hypothetical protein